LLQGQGKKHDRFVTIAPLATSTADDWGDGPPTMVRQTV
jgi:hypothetical protein